MAPDSQVPSPGGLVGVVVIGRNEGERLRRCFDSVVGAGRQVIYVDSGSTDGSVRLAQSMGVETVALDLATPFTAARARNAGFARLRSLQESVDHVQFVDGDCEVAPQWIEQAVYFLAAQPAVAIVCGRRRERFPERSVFNRLCDIEWTMPIGEIRACGGDALMRVDAFEAVGGYNPSLIAGEEPELCVRLRQAQWKVWCLDAPMTLHDAAILRWSQWWNRTKRAGHAFAEGAALHGAPPECHWVAESRRALAWGLGIPCATLLACLLIDPHAFLLLAVYPAQVIRLAYHVPPEQPGRWARAFFLVLGKFPEMLGAMRYFLHRGLHRPPVLIEYK